MSLNAINRLGQQQQPFLPPSFDSNAWLTNSAFQWGLDHSSQPAKQRNAKKDSKHKRHKKHSKKHRKHRKRQISAYILQLIGLICLILAAVKTFEPLTGVGFTLVIVGYKGGIGGGKTGIEGWLGGEEKWSKKSRRRRGTDNDGEAKRKVLKEEADDE